MLTIRHVACMATRHAGQGNHGSFREGCKTMTLGAIILGLAVTMGFVSNKLQTADFIVQLLGDNIPIIALPALLTAL